MAKMFIFRTTGKYNNENRYYPSFTTKGVNDSDFIHDRKRKTYEFYPSGTLFSPIEMFFDQDEPNDKRFELSDTHTWIGKKPRGLIYPISSRFKLILDKMKLQSTAFYKAEVNFYEKLEVYWLFHINIKDYVQYIDFEKSEFGNMDFSSKELISDQSFKADNITEIYELSSNSNWLSWGFRKAVMKSKFKDIDLLNIPTYGTLISQKLKNEIEKNNLTGMRITDCPIEFEISNDEIS